jgi:release factor glutamine methyltransferase
LDLGTGSGAIAITLAKIFKRSKIIATDINEKALGIAQENALSASMSNISFAHSDWFCSIPEYQKYNIIVSNPPYISVDDDDIDLCVKKYEPEIALFSQNNGFAALFKLIEKATGYLKSGGRIYLEHGHKQGEDVAKQFRSLNYKDISKIFDLSGKWRGTSAQRE